MESITLDLPAKTECLMPGDVKSTLEQEVSRLNDSLTIKREQPKNCKQFVYTDFKEPIWTIEGWLRYCAKFVVGAEEKVGKSKIVMLLSVALATGKDFLGKFPIVGGKPVKVLYFDGENSTNDIKMQMIQACLAQGVITPDDVIDETHVKPDLALPENLFIYGSEYEIDLEAQESMDYIESEIKRLNPGLVVFDSFYTFFDNDQNKETEQKAISNEFSRWITKYSCGICVIQHFNKGNTGKGYTNKVSMKRITGSAIWGKWYSTAWLMSNPNVDEGNLPVENLDGSIDFNVPGGKMCMLIQRHFRGAARGSDVYMELDITPRSCDITLGKKPSKEEKKIVKRDNMDASIFGYIGEHPNRTASTIGEALNLEYGYREKDVTARVRQLADKHQLIATPKGNGSIYSLIPVKEDL